MTTGYEGPTDDEKFVGTQIWKVKSRQNPGHPSLMAIISIQEGTNSRVIGYLTCQDEGEFKWIKAHLDGG